MIIGIVCVDKNFGIGKNNDLLFHLPVDMNFFKTMTAESIVITGYNNLLSFPGSKPLKGRSTICICPPDIERDDCYCVHDFPTLLHLVQELSKTQNVYIIGGAMLYESFLDFYDKVYVTKVDSEGDADVFFPNLDENTNFILSYCSKPIKDGEHSIRFCTYYRQQEV
jgi:dihydrofolate reductase